MSVEELSIEELEEALLKKKKPEQYRQKMKEKAYAKKRDNFIVEACLKFESLNEDLRKLKNETSAGISELYNEMFELNGKKVSATKSFLIKTTDGQYRLTMEYQDKFEFNSDAVVHINTIKEILKNKFERVNKEMYGLLDEILMKNGKGDYDAKLLTKARRKIKNLNNAELNIAFEKLQDCLVVVGTSVYTRASKRDEKGKYHDITLQFSSF